MMGGNPVTVGRVKPLLENFSTNIVHFGDIGERPYLALHFSLLGFMSIVFIFNSSFIIFPKSPLSLTYPILLFFFFFLFIFLALTLAVAVAM